MGQFEQFPTRPQCSIAKPQYKHRNDAVTSDGSILSCIMVDVQSSTRPAPCQDLGVMLSTSVGEMWGSSNMRGDFLSEA